MVVELKGQQIRIRIKSPKQFSKLKTDDVGDGGKLQRIAGHNNKGWQTQAWRVNLSDYNNFEEAKKDINSLKISKSKKQSAIRKARDWFR